MKHSLTRLATAALLAAIACILPSFASGEEAFTPSVEIPDVPASYYFEALEVLETKDIKSLDSIDFLKFRRAFLAARDPNNLAVPDTLDAQFHAVLSQEDPNAREVVQICNQILALDFTDINRHVIRNYFLDQLGQDPAFYQEVTKRLVDSILDSGDGKTPETAFHVFQLKEEDEVLKMYQLQLVSQTLLKLGDHSFDRVDCVDDEGKTYRIYFDITEHMQNLGASLGAVR